ncbi:Transporter associated domain protein [compost metagenome]
MEDLLEEIVDEIQDEFDTEEILPVVELPDGYSVDGRVLIGEVNDLTGLEINDSDIDTIAGYLYQIANGDISEGYSVDIDGVRFSVVEMKHNHVSRIIIQKI